MNIPPYGEEFRKAFSPFANLLVSAQNSPNMTVKISAGGFWSHQSTGPSYVEYAGGNSAVLTAPNSNAKWSVIVMNYNGAISVTDGSSSSSPTLPAIARTKLPLAAVYLQSTSTIITNDMIFDLRPLFSIIPFTHIDLAGTTSSDCHSIAAVTGLQAALDLKAASADVTTSLASKADDVGTNQLTFTLNQDQTGTPSSNLSLVAERGSSTNTSIRWNESSDKWEHSDNGTDYIAFSSYYLNDGTQDILIKLYDQTAIPTLDTDNKIALWKDDSNKIYIVFRRGSGDQVKVELT